MFSRFDSIHLTLYFQLQVGSINDVDSFDTDRLSGSIQYDDDNVPQPIMDYEIIRKDEKKSKKKGVRNKHMILNI